MSSINILTSLRVALFVICAEGAYSYWNWWLRVRKSENELKTSFLTLALMYSAITFFAAAAFLPPYYRTTVLLIGNPVVLTAMVIGIFPYWRLWRLMTRWNVGRAIFIRFAIIVSIVTLIMIFDPF